MIYLHANNEAARRATLFEGGRKLHNVEWCLLLWNNGPGFIGYFPTNVNGTFYVAPDGEVARAIRFSRSLRIDLTSTTGVSK